MADKNFKVKSGLQVPSLTTAGPVVTDASGNVTSSATLPISQGGTGQTTAGNALNALLPVQGGGNINKYLQTNGTNTQWNTVLQPVYSADAPSDPLVGQVWIESDSSSDSFDPNIIRRKTITATAGQTTFTTDLEFIQGYEQVYFNGMLLLRTSDYTTPSNTSVVLAAAAAAGDIVEILSITNLNSINAATTTTNTFTGNQTIQGTLNTTGNSANKVNISSKFTIDTSNAWGVISLARQSGTLDVMKIQGADATGASNALRLVNGSGNASAIDIFHDSLRFYVNSDTTERMRIDASGKITINGATGINVLNVGGNISTYFSPGSYPNMRGIIEHSGQTAGLRIISQGVNLGTDVSGAISFWTSSSSSANASTDANISERMRINADGNVNIGGASNPGDTLRFLDIYNANSGNSAGSIIRLITNNIANNGLTTVDIVRYRNGDFYIVNNEGPIRFGSNGVDRMRIDTNGYLLIGYTSSNGAYRLQVNSQIFATSSTIATSDGRYKENINTIESGLSIIDALRPVSFNWKEHAVHNFPEGKTVGFIAQEVQEALADYDWVDNLIKTNYNEETEEEFLGIAEGNLIPLLVAAVKELKSRVETLEAENV